MRGGAHLKDLVDGFAEAVEVVLYQTWKRKKKIATSDYNYLKILSRKQSCVTFSLEALLPEDADQSQELGDLLEVEHRGVVELDDGQRLLVVGAAAAVLHEPAGKEIARRCSSVVGWEKKTH